MACQSSAIECNTRCKELITLEEKVKYINSIVHESTRCLLASKLVHSLENKQTREYVVNRNYFVEKKKKKSSMAPARGLLGNCPPKKSRA